jgi:hypothetical protein
VNVLRKAVPVEIFKKKTLFFSLITEKFEVKQAHRSPGDWHKPIKRKAFLWYVDTTCLKVTGRGESSLLECFKKNRFPSFPYCG